MVVRKWRWVCFLNLGTSASAGNSCAPKSGAGVEQPNSETTCAAPTWGPALSGALSGTAGDDVVVVGSAVSAIAVELIEARAGSSLCGTGRLGYYSRRSLNIVVVSK